MVFLEYINFEHNTVAAELVRQTYDTPPLAFAVSYTLLDVYKRQGSMPSSTST